MSDGSRDGPEPPDPSRPPAPTRKAEQVVSTLLEEPGLRVTLVAVVGILASFGAWMASSTIRSRSLGALAVLLAFAWLSVEGIRSELRRRRRPGPLSALIGLVWVLTAALTWAGLHWKVL